MGLSVNKLRQKLSGSDVSSVAKKLIKSWKRLLPGTRKNTYDTTIGDVYCIK